MTENARKRKSIQGMMFDLNEKREHADRKFKHDDSVGWNMIDNKKYLYEMEAIDRLQQDALLKAPRAPNVPTGVLLFQAIISMAVMGKAIDLAEANNPEVFHWKQGGKCDISHSALLMIYALKIRIIGLQESAKRNEKNDRPLRESINEARGHFYQITNHMMQNYAYCEKIITHLLLTYEVFPEINSNMRKLVVNVGEWVALDEKLLRFVGCGGDVMIIKSKPDQIGNWYYQLCVKLKTGDIIQLWTKLQRSANGVGNSVVDVVEEVVNFLLKGYSGMEDPIIQTNGLLVFDSYYFTAASRKSLQDNRNNIKYVCSVKQNNINGIWKACQQSMIENPEHNVAKPGQWHGLFHEENKELFIFKHDEDRNIGKKYCFSNAYTQKNRRAKQKDLSKIVPGYDVYKHIFWLCDEFNKGFRDRKWPFKAGGNGIFAEWAHHDKFIFSATLRNIFAMEADIDGFEPNERCFQDNCILLADNLFRHALKLKESGL